MSTAVAVDECPVTPDPIPTVSFNAKPVQPNIEEPDVQLVGGDAALTRTTHELSCTEHFSLFTLTERSLSLLFILRCLFLLPPIHVGCR